MTQLIFIWSAPSPDWSVLTSDWSILNELLIGRKRDYPQVQFYLVYIQSDNNYHFSSEKRMKYYPINSTGFQN